MNAMSKKRAALTGAALALTLAAGGCSNLEPQFDSVLARMKSFFSGDEAAETRPSAEAEAIYAEAVRLRGEGRNEAWTHRLEKAAELGHPAAAYEVGMLYRQGEHVHKDAHAADRWIRRAAELGDQRAQYEMGTKLLAGDGVPADPARAVEYLARAGEQGHVEAQYLMGNAYANGAGVATNPAWAARWYGRAARAGHADAQYAYGRMFLTGTGLPKSDRAAYWWLTLASAGGHATAADVAMEAAAHLSAEDISQVEADAKRFVPKRYTTLTDPATVMFVQYALRSMGYDAGPVDGLPGEKTRQGIRAYEQAANLPPDGQISVMLLDGLVESTSR